MPVFRNVAAEHPQRVGLRGSMVFSRQSSWVELAGSAGSGGEAVRTPISCDTYCDSWTAICEDACEKGGHGVAVIAECGEVGDGKNCYRTCVCGDGEGGTERGPGTPKLGVGDDTQSLDLS
jgi:hypothetical protein